MSNSGYPHSNKVDFQTILLGPTQKLAIGASSVQSVAVQSITTIIRIFSTVDCYIKTGTNPTATSSDAFIPGGIIQYFGIHPGEKIAVIQDTTSGILNIIEGA